MSDFQALLDRAAGAATCDFLNAFGSGLVSAGAWSAVSGAPALVPLGLGAAALLASNAACNWDSSAPSTVEDLGPLGGMCWETDGSFDIEWWRSGVYAGNQISDIRRITRIYDRRYYSFSGATAWKVDYRDSKGVAQVDEYFISPTDEVRQSFNSGRCVQPGPGSDGRPGPYDYTDTATGCELTVNWEGIRLGEDGRPYPIYKIEPKAGTARASGAIIGGCNFSPVLYVGGGGGGGIPPVPYPPSPPSPPDRPWWWDFADDAIGGIIGAAARKLLDELLQQKVAGRVYRLASACEVNDAGEPIDQAAEVVIPDLSMTKAIVYRLDALEYLLQAHKDFKQPICSKKDPLTGEPVTVRFRSDTNSPAGNAPLEKSLTYRDQTAAPLVDHADHWVDFTWQAGPICVISKGLSWGFPQVWASSADEGKRVLAHAASIAGVDLNDPKHRWLVTGSSDGRYGMTGTMRVRRRGGALCVSKRNGASGLPLLAVPPHP